MSSYCMPEWKYQNDYLFLNHKGKKITVDYYYMQPSAMFS